MSDSALIREIKSEFSLLLESHILLLKQAQLIVTALEQKLCPQRGAPLTPEMKSAAQKVMDEHRQLLEKLDDKSPDEEENDCNG